jgi:catechol 2,3-dioxygenase-like lactoylglutathione lyase family enzyme
VALNHVALTVSDRDRSAEFYDLHFGLVERVHEDDHLLILGDGSGGLLALSRGTPPTPLPRTNHFGFLLDSADEVRAARARFAAAGLEETEWQEGGPIRVQVLDPDGYRVEVYAY